ncbi:hypothetical protein ACQ4M3_05305 [Leptolyngbya sp. AN03gr2]|uniref:hypothetical protein n=1 Tax=unclassified Leptolyngbya TaxID=2650499 RepID=UPI003D30FDD2
MENREPKRDSVILLSLQDWQVAHIRETIPAYSRSKRIREAMVSAGLIPSEPPQKETSEAA